jgi:alginate O-acetyltransferase complex protein AlgI
MLKPNFRFAFLLVSSLFFYFWGETFIVWVLLFSSIIDYCCGLIISNGFKKDNLKKLDEGTERSPVQKIGLAVSIISNLSLLAYFKYANFFVENVRLLLGNMGFASPAFDNFTKIALPLGISFYTFQTMSYTIDVYLGKIKANRNFIQFASFVTMFPQLVAGPIVRYRDIEDQMNEHKIKTDDFVYGIKRFIIGLAKKVIIANTMASVVDAIFALPISELSMGVAWLGLLAYSLQIYFDFSGYSCMAIGMGKMIGFTFPENFNYPYMSQSIQEFWKRWHITLSTWFRDYLYIPLGGSRKGELFTYRNLIIVFFLCGLWHGAEWNFIIWGSFHGFFLVLERTPFRKLLDKIPAFLRIGYMHFVLMIGWVFFRAENLSDAMQYMKVVWGFGETHTQFASISELMPIKAIVIFIAGLILSAPVFFWVQKKSEKYLKNNVVRDLSYLFLLSVLFVVCIMMLASGTYNPFIYFRF